MIKNRYKSKAKASFKTKKALFLFYNALNNTCPTTKEGFHNFEIKDDLVESYSAEYWQQKDDFKLNGEITVKDVHLKVLELEKQNEKYFKEVEQEYVDGFEKVFPFKEFQQLITPQNAKCEYCGITTERIEQLADKRKIFKKSLRGWTLEIDRLNSNYEYTPDNCVLSCYWCNNAKTDEFTIDEFRKIGQVIGQIWEERSK